MEFLHSGPRRTERLSFVMRASTPRHRRATLRRGVAERCSDAVRRSLGSAAATTSHAPGSCHRPMLWRHRFVSSSSWSRHGHLHIRPLALPPRDAALWLLASPVASFARTGSGVSGAAVFREKVESHSFPTERTGNDVSG